MPYNSSTTGNWYDWVSRISSKLIPPVVVSCSAPCCSLCAGYSDCSRLSLCCPPAIHHCRYRCVRLSIVQSPLQLITMKTVAGREFFMTVSFYRPLRPAPSFNDQHRSQRHDLNHRWTLLTELYGRLHELGSGPAQPILSENSVKNDTFKIYNKFVTQLHVSL